MKRWVFALFIFCLPVQLSAFELAYTCGELGQPCLEGERPKQVFWRKSCVPYYVNELGSADFNGFPDDLLEIVQSSFQQWNDAEPGFQLSYAGLTNIRKSEEFDGNVVTWRDDEWPYASTQALALTIISFDADTGEILDADIEFNSVVHDFSLAEEATVDTVDFRSTLTHEVGHFVGLDHSQETEATMFGRSSPGQTKKRTLHPDDLAGFSEIYPSSKAGVCAEVPDYLESGEEDDGCCATMSPRRSQNGSLVFLLVLAVLGIRTRRL